jgi:hypothetical protein
MLTLFLHLFLLPPGIKVDYNTVPGPFGSPIVRHRVWFTRGQFFGSGPGAVLCSPFGGASMLDFSTGQPGVPQQVSSDFNMRLSVSNDYLTIAIVDTCVFSSIMT